MAHRTAPQGQGSDVVTATADTRGVLTGWSEGAELLFGYRPEDVLGHPAAGLLAEDHAGEPLAARRTWSGRVAVRHKDGHDVPGDLLAHRRRTETGSDWLLVWGVSPTPRTAREDIPLSWCFDQAPCNLAVFDTDLRYVRVNADNERAVALSEDQIRGLRATEAVPHPECEKIEHALRRVMETGERQYVELYMRVRGEDREHAWAIHLAPLTDPEGRRCGVSLAARDTTEQYEARQRLRFLAEAGTRIGTGLDLALTARQLADMAVPRLADYAAVDLLAGLDAGREPPPEPVNGPVTLRRAARQSVLEGVPETAFAVGDSVGHPAASPSAAWRTADRPVAYAMTDPALADWAGHHPDEVARLRGVGAHSVLVAPLRARGATLGWAVFVRHHRAEPFVRDDLLLAEELAARTAVCLDNARRYSRERTAAEAFQRSLLPQWLAQPEAVEVASRYRPAGTRSGVGGDWFDVVPLSGARAALSIGDVVGRGIHASATMARVRTAVRTLADIDLPPDELLAHLDDLVLRLCDDAPEDCGPKSAGVLGATCLYAVCDPVSRRCCLARAGHVPPAVRYPDGTVTFLDLPAGPPLGLGGVPFESAEFELPEGSVLALYTDGLIARRDRDAGAGLDLLRDVLARPADSLEAACDAVLDAMLPEPADDDVALLLARTRALAPDRVAGWELPAEPESVGRARKDAVDQLAAWGLEELGFVTELVVSELVTNAIRHGRPPVRLRLIRDRTLICEVSDRSNTAPHLRRARESDEGGRGLLLVAQLTARWGTRHTRTGKTIWAEQRLPGHP